MNKSVLTLLIDRHDNTAWFLDYNIFSMGQQMLKLSSATAMFFRKCRKIAVVIHVDYGEDPEPQTKVDTFDHRISVSDLIEPLLKRIRCALEP